MLTEREALERVAQEADRFLECDYRMQGDSSSLHEERLRDALVELAIIRSSGPAPPSERSGTLAETLENVLEPVSPAPGTPASGQPRRAGDPGATLPATGTTERRRSRPKGRK